MKKLYFILFFFPWISGNAQDKYIDKALGRFDHLKLQLIYAKEDTNKVRILDSLGQCYAFLNTDSALVCLRQALSLAKKLAFKSGEGYVLRDLGIAFANQGDYAKALAEHSKAMRIAESIGDKGLYYDNIIGTGYANGAAGYYQKSLDNYYLALAHLVELRKGVYDAEFLYTLIAVIYQTRTDKKLKKADSIQYFVQKAYQQDLKNKTPFAMLYSVFATIAVENGDYKKAISYMRAICLAPRNDIAKLYGSVQLAGLYQTAGNADSAIYFARQVIALQKTLSMLPALFGASQTMAEIYATRHQTDSVLKYQSIMLTVKDSLFNQQKANAIQNLSLDEQQHRQALLNAENGYRNRIKIYILSGAALAFLVIGFILWRNNKKQKHTNQLLNEQKEEISAQRDNLKHQNHELEIEAALEQVRLRTMAMQRSNELVDVSIQVRTQVKGLGIPILGMGFIVWSDDSNFFTNYGADPSGGTINPYTVDVSSAEMFKEIRDARKRGDDFFVLYGEGEQLKEVYEALSKYSDAPRDIFKDQIDSTTGQLTHSVFVSNVSLLFITNEPVPEAHDIFKRFGKTFDQTYTRFLDLKQAEEQAHEAQIQLALERVRARTMAMQRSGELAETAHVLYQQFTSLGETPIQITIGIINSEDNTIEFWGTDLTGNKNDKTAKGSLDEPFLLNKLFAAWKKKEKSAMIALSGRELKGWIEYRQQISGLTSPDDDMQGTRYVYLGYFSKGAISISTEDPLPRETIIILERFAAVFDGTYTRFLDLKKAEAQAREAQIEAALERVRSKTMAMYNSQDVAGTSVTMFQELVKLGVESTARCGVSIISNTNDLEVWTASLKDDGSVTLNIGHVSITAHPLLLNVFTSWKDGESSTTYEMTGDAVRSYFQALNDAPGYPFQYPLDSLPEKLGINAFFFPEGCLFAFTSEPLSAEMSQVFKRFAGVFGQTYRRFLDLQKAESQAREAIKQASVDRVRGEIASMRTTLDLERIIPLVWNELTILGIPFIRCGVFIVNEEAELIHTHLSTPDGKALAAFDMAFDAQDINREALHAWRKKQIATIHWSAEVFAAYTKDLISQGAVISDGKYVVERPDTPLDLHFFPFLQGMLYVGNTAPLSDDEKDLVQSLAYAFSTAYARYEDFNKLEAAKQQVDKTLVELKAAQKQLVQSEKMASLGELTAGIAHEIQNPLNFVNNFSEVSAELIEEMTEELDKGDIEEVKVIAGDIRDNLEKIRHHGKRADGIVKGMLQHSRASSGQKEPTDLNVLADEYLRLSYHGLRAKDKSFNAELVTHFDKKLPKVSVVPQDMGRVILNIINNAFYATQQRQKTAGSDYKPTVEVKTQAWDGQALISVKDNGVGIPESIRDKIMQPFFTTKPTGEGTGLGLSLSYDIVVKSHGGNINVNTKENEYTEFTVILPIS